MTTMTWMASKSTDSAEMMRRQNCVSSVYRKQTNSGVGVESVDVNVLGGNGRASVGASTTIGGQGWGSGNSYARDTESCDSQGQSANYFAQNRFERTGKL